jgi:hypothetical protein
MVECLLRTHFLRITQANKEFLQLSLEQFSEYLLNDDLNIRHEENLFDICIRWIDHASHERKRVRLLFSLSPTCQLSSHSVSLH